MDKLVILDRDGTINIDKHYLSDPEELELLPGAAQGMRDILSMGYRLAIATNQSAIARGYFDIDRLDAIHRTLLKILDAERIGISAIEYCPHIPEDYCYCRKPKPGMALKITRKLNIAMDAAKIFVVGDRESDIGLAHAINARSIFIAQNTNDVPDYGQSSTVLNLTEAAQYILTCK